MRERFRPPRWKPVLVLGVLAVGLWVGGAAVKVALAVSDLRAGERVLLDVQRRGGDADVLTGSLAGDLRRAERRVFRAQHHLSSPILAPARLLPVLGRQMRSLDALSGAGHRLLSVGAASIEEAGRLLEQPATVDNRITLVRRVGELAATARQRLDVVPLGPDEGLLAPLAERRAELARRFDGIRGGLSRTSSGAEALSGFLRGPRRYLVFAANNSEMRAGAGMFLSFGVLETSAGRLALGDFRTVADVEVPPGVVPLERDLAERWGWLHPNEDWRNLMLSPRFDASAALAARMWEAAGEPAVDGVLALDPVFIKHLLTVLGPVTVEGITVDATSVVDELTHRQYVRFPSIEVRPERWEKLGQIARATFSALDSGGWRIPDVAEALASSVKSRHLLAWSARSEEQEGWRAAGADGSLGADSLLVSVLNRGGNKLDRFLKVDADLACSRSGPGTACSLRLGLDNVTPDGEPPYVAGPHPGSDVNAGDYLGILAVNLPAAARDSTMGGVDQLAVAGADGVGRVIGHQLVVPRGEQRTVTVRFHLPGHHGSIRVEPSARVPGILWSSGGQTWEDGASRTIRW